MRKWSFLILAQNKTFLLLFFITINLFFRLIYIGGESIFEDEAFSLYSSQQPLDKLLKILSQDRNPPLYFTLLHYWIRIGGIDSGWAKGLSVIFATGAAVFIFLIAWDFSGRLAAIIVSALFLTSGVVFTYSHEIRAFALSSLLCSASFYVYFRMVARAGIKHIFILGFLNACLLYSHFVTVFIPFAQGVGILLFVKENRQSFRILTGSFIITFLLFIPHIAIVISNVPKAGHFWLSKPDLKDLFYVFQTLSGTMKVFQLHVLFILAFIVILLFDRTHKIVKESFNYKVYLVLVLWYLVPVLGDYFVAQYTPVFRLKYLYYTTGGLFLLIAFIPGSLRIGWYFKLLITVILLYYPVRWINLRPDVTEDWKSFVPKVMEIKTEAIPVLISAHYKKIDFAYYYNKDIFRDYKNIISRLSSERIFCLGDSSGMAKVDLKETYMLIFVNSHNKGLDKDSTIHKNLLSQGFRESYRYGRWDVKMIVYRRNADFFKTHYAVISSDKFNNCQGWMKETLVNPVNHDTALYFYNGMEIEGDCGKQSAITNVMVKSGNFACRSGKDSPYGIGLLLKTDRLDGRRVIMYSADIFPEAKTYASLVISLEKEGKSLFRKDYRITDILAPGEWGKLELETVLPETYPEGSEIRIYIWNREEPAVYSDNIDIMFCY
ncbi:MAG: glycosyltransferase family 39 protein [Bacteroidales bacterium]|nr:glycosyltransferase family 39 protein [Bacteroidales bacterium]